MELTSPHRCWMNSVELNLHSIPKMFNQDQIWTQQEPHPQLNVVLHKNILGDPCCVRQRTVLLENGVSAFFEERHNLREHHLIDETLCSDATSLTRTNVLEEDRPEHLLQANSTPRKHAWATPGIVFLKAGIHIAFASSSPHPDSAIYCAHTVATFVSEQDMPPLPPGPVHVALCPLQASLSMMTCQHWSMSWVAVLQSSLHLSPSHRWPLMSALWLPIVVLAVSSAV